MKKEISKRLLNIMLTLVMVFTMMPIMPGAVKEVEAASTSIDVNGQTMTNGTYFRRNDDSYAYYADGVLTLHNYTVTEGYVFESMLNSWGVPVSFDACIYSKDPLIIQLEGENFISSVGSEYMLDFINKRWGILCQSNLVIRGTGSLNMSSDYFPIDAVSTTIESGTLNVKARYDDKMDEWECNPIYNLYVKDGNVNFFSLINKSLSPPV